MSRPHENGVLKDFLMMRKNLQKSAPPESVASDNKAKAKKGGKTSDALTGELTGITVATIIENKPGKKEVSEYFQREADRLTNSKMK